MAAKFGKACGNFSLIDGEKEGIFIFVQDVADLQDKGTRCLVGRLRTDKKINKEAFQSLLSRLWRLVGRVSFKEIQENLWIIEFSDGVDRQRVLEGRPWSFDRYILVLNDFVGTIPPSQMEFLHSPFWVQVHDMPLICMNKEVGTKIGQSLGELVAVDVAGDGGSWERFLWLRIILDLSKPLERVRALHIQGTSCWVTFKYEKLPLFCFTCGRILHGPSGCPGRLTQHPPATDDIAQWGAWIRADEVSQFSGRGFPRTSSRYPKRNGPSLPSGEDGRWTGGGGGVSNKRSASHSSKGKSHSSGSFHTSIPAHKESHNSGSSSGGNILNLSEESENANFQGCNPSRLSRNSTEAGNLLDDPEYLRKERGGATQGIRPDSFVSSINNLGLQVGCPLDGPKANGVSQVLEGALQS
jgi:hypothetical protein